MANINGIAINNNDLANNIDYCSLASTSEPTTSEDRWVPYNDWSITAQSDNYRLGSLVGYTGIIIPKGTKTIMCGGSTAGHYAAHLAIRITSEDNQGVAVNDILVQPSGNLYWQAALPTRIFELDESKSYVVRFDYNLYQTSSFHLNEGFGVSATNIWALKLK